MKKWHPGVWGPGALRVSRGLQGPSGPPGHILGWWFRDLVRATSGSPSAPSPTSQEQGSGRPRRGATVPLAVGRQASKLDRPGLRA